VATYNAKVHVKSQNNLGQFTRDIKRAGQGTVEEMVKEGANLSRALAPEGHKHDRRTLPLKQSIIWKMHGRTNGSWGSVARHALAQELGNRGGYPIVGDLFLQFFWENAGRNWVPGLYGEPDIVIHPGHGKQPFLEPALTILMTRWQQIARRHYSRPGR
jgi:hypothetical protein